MVSARWADPSEAGDKRLIYVRVLDENGTPQAGQPFRVMNIQARIERTKGAGYDAFWGNAPMYGEGVFTVDIPETASDRIHCQTGIPGNPAVNTCFFLTFQRGATAPLDGPTPDDDLDQITRARLRALLDQAQAEIDAARRLLEERP